MADDYRNSKYCPKLTDLTKKKNDVKDSVSSKHPRAQDMHTYISNNNEPFKQQFIEAYNGNVLIVAYLLKLFRGKCLRLTI